MAGEELFGGFTAHSYGKTVADSTNWSSDRDYYAHGHRPYMYGNTGGNWFTKDECGLTIFYWDYSSGSWVTSNSRKLGDNQSGSILCSSSHVWKERWRLHYNTDYNDGTQKMDYADYKIYDVAYLQKNLGYSAARKYVMKLDTSTRDTNISPNYEHTKIYASDFLMGRTSRNSWN